MSVSEKEKLTHYLGDFEERHAYVDSTIRQLLAAKIKALRVARNYDQETLGILSGGMKQSSVSRLEDPTYAKMTLKTLKRLGKAFDVALIVDFVPFSELVNRTIGRTEADYAPPSYDKEQQMSFAGFTGDSTWAPVTRLFPTVVGSWEFLGDTTVAMKEGIEFSKLARALKITVADQQPSNVGGFTQAEKVLANVA